MQKKKKKNGEPQIYSWGTQKKKKKKKKFPLSQSESEQSVSHLVSQKLSPTAVSVHNEEPGCVLSIPGHFLFPRMQRVIAVVRQLIPSVGWHDAEVSGVLDVEDIAIRVDGLADDVCVVA